MKHPKRYNPAKFSPVRGGHAQGHLRDVFLEVVSFLEEHELGELRLDAKIAEQEAVNPYTVGEIVGLLWNCTDSLPGAVRDVLLTAGLEFSSSTFGAAARALKRALSD